MFCGKCGKNIGDLKACPYCNPESQPQEEDNKTTLFRDDAYPQPITPEPHNYPSAPQVDQPYQQPYNYSPVGQPIETLTPQNPPYSYPAAPPSSTQGFAVPPVQNEPEKKKPKKGLIVAIVVILAVLLVGGGVAAFFITAPMRNYNKAMDLKDSGDYEKAIEILTDLDGYEDSFAQITECMYLNAKQKIDNEAFEEARAILTELGEYKDSKDELDRCNYLYAKKLLADGKYDDAKFGFLELGNYEDSKDLIKECDYGRATQLLNDKKYEDAKKVFESLGSYSDAKTKIKECNYFIGKEKISSDPADAIELLEDAGDYKDSKDLLKQAKMNYCEKNKNSTDSNTYKYLKELKAEKYSGAAALYKELYTLKITNVFWNTDSDDSTTKMKTIKSGDKAVLHFELTGYTPDTTYFKIECQVTDGAGSKVSKDFSGIYHKFTYTLTGASKGTLKVDIYSTDGTKTKINTATVQIV